MPSETPLARKVRQARDQLERMSSRGRAIRARQRLIERLLGPATAPNDDGRQFMLMLAEMAEFGATDIAPSDREETARAAKRALVNQLLLAWAGDPAVIERLRTEQAKIEEEIE